MEKRGLLLLLVMLLASSHLITSSHAFPAASSITGGRRLLNDRGQLPAVGDSMKMTMNPAQMDIESNDYPGSGANNRHTPKPPGRT